MTQNYINHIALVLDASSSMSAHRSAVVKAADAFVAQLAKQSKTLDQETRITLYTFSNAQDIQCVVYDKDVLRMPSLAGLCLPIGRTALVDAAVQAIDDLEQTAQLYGDHAFLCYVITDGAENASRKHTGSSLRLKLEKLKDNWTLAVLVPDVNGEIAAQKLGFPSGNIAQWDVKDFVSASRMIERTTDAYMTARSTGVRGSRNLFTLDTSNISRSKVQRLAKLGPGQFRMYPVLNGDPSAIADFVERNTGRAYRLGEAFYQLTKPVDVQPQKEVALYERRGHAVYTGREARQLLGLPDYTVKVNPAAHPDYEVFIQSTSVNRKLVPGTNILLLSR